MKKRLHGREVFHQIISPIQPVYPIQPVIANSSWQIFDYYNYPLTSRKFKAVLKIFGKFLRRKIHPGTVT